MMIALLFQETAHAAVGAGAPAEGGLMGTLISLAPMIAIFGVFYFLMIRPQQQRQKQHRELLGALQKGDTVVTSGGIIGKVAKLEELEAVIDTGEGGKLRIIRSMIIEVRGKTPPAPANDAKAS